MPSVSTDRHTLTIQMRKYSPALPVNLSETALPADCGAADEFATSLPLFLSSMADAERAASIDVRSLGLKEFGPAHIRIKFTDLRRGPPGLERPCGGPIFQRSYSGEIWPWRRRRPRKPWASRPR